MFVDIDSIYGYSESFVKVVNFLGRGSRWKLANKIRHTNNLSSSRFGIDCRRLHNFPITLNGNKVHKINFEDLPSLILCQATIEKMDGVLFTIGFHMTGMLSMRKSGYFTHLETAVLLAAMNLSKLKLLERNNITLSQRQEISKLPKFLCDTTNVYMKTHHHLNSDKMVLFVEEFEKWLRKLADPVTYDSIDFNCYTGFSEKKFDKYLFQKAASFLSHHYVITFSTAGIKNYYMKNASNSIKIDNGKTSCGKLFGSLAFEKLMEKKANSLLSTLNGCFNTMGGTKIPFFYDVGYELVPKESRNGFFINAGLGRDALVRMLQ